MAVDVMRVGGAGNSYAIYDFHQTPPSPGNDAADADSAPAADFDGQPRRDVPPLPNIGNGTPPYVDMGCYEARP